MKKITLFETSYAKTRPLAIMAGAAVPFLIKNGPAVLLQPNQIKELENTRIYSSTPMSKLFQDIVNANKLNNFIFMNLARYSSDIPEVLALDDITVDGKNIPNVIAPKQLQKCWINLTPITTVKDSYNGSLNLTDVSAFTNMVLRSALVSTYNDSDIWLNPRLSATVIEMYAFTVSHVLTQAFGLTYEEEKFVQTLFACYYAQLLGGANDSLKMPALLMRCTFLGSAQDIILRMEQILQYRDNNGEDILTPVKIISILNQCGPARMKNFMPTMLHRYFSASSLDSQIMLIALEYPPYFVFQMLRLTSGYKNVLMKTVTTKYKQLLLKLNQFASDMQTTNALLIKLNRG